MNGFQPFNAAAVSPGPGLLSPATNGARKVSADANRTPSRADSLKPNGIPTSPSATSPVSAASENSPAPWSSAIGPATTSGKSGRVIERLMSENDKLKRDLNEQVIRCQELEKGLQTYKPQLEALQQENDNLSHARSVDSNLISRRDRKIEELKAELATEKQRREKAETLAREREREKDDIEEKSRRDLQSMTESTKHATVHAEIMETSHRQLAAEYRARTEAFKKDLSSITTEREHDRQKLARLDIVTDQMRQELERQKKLNSDVVDAWERLQDEQTTRMQAIVSKNDQADEHLERLRREMESVVSEMRWLMGVKKTLNPE